jgi:hypothetical protein
MAPAAEKDYAAAEDHIASRRKRQTEPNDKITWSPLFYEGPNAHLISAECEVQNRRSAKKNGVMREKIAYCVSNSRGANQAATREVRNQIARLRKQTARCVNELRGCAVAQSMHGKSRYCCLPHRLQVQRPTMAFHTSRRPTSSRPTSACHR